MPAPYRMRLCLLPALALAAAFAPLHAQTVPLVYTISASGGVMQYDLSGTGDDPMWAGRLEAPWTKWLVLESGFVFATPKQDFGDTTKFVILEGQAQVQQQIFVFRPYLGVGAGMAMDFREDVHGGDRYFGALSGAVGVRAPLRDKLGIRTELRVRGIGRNFAASTAEWTLGLSWRLGSD